MNLWTRPEAERRGHRQAERRLKPSPGDAPLAHTAGVRVAVPGLLREPTAPRGLVAEAAAEARGTRAALAHAPTARTVVAETVDTAAVCREEEGAGRLRQGWGWLGARMQLGSAGHGAASKGLASGSHNQRSSQTQ